MLPEPYLGPTPEDYGDPGWSDCSVPEHPDDDLPMTLPTFKLLPDYPHLEPSDASGSGATALAEDESFTDEYRLDMGGWKSRDSMAAYAHHGAAKRGKASAMMSAKVSLAPPAAKEVADLSMMSQQMSAFQLQMQMSSIQLQMQSMQKLMESSKE
ncbi:hypothetical protein V8C86DRAFT_3137538 [Haematococcus lacustris]